MTTQRIARPAALVVLGWLVAAGLLAIPATAQDIDKGPPPRHTAVPQPTAVPGAAPTIDRLAAPPTVPSPTQADEGAQLFWLHCQPCHGDQGQGLTDEWRAQYPPEDQNCWESGCHGPRPYELGFILPTQVPAVIGPGTLSRFQTLEGLYQYVSVAMPYFFPGDLTEAEYLAIVAHLARANGLGDGATLTRANIADQRFPWAAQVIATPPAVLVATPQPPAPVLADQLLSLAPLAVGLVVVILGGIVLWLRHGRSN
jgi:hypothetical protein